MNKSIVAGERFEQRMSSAELHRLRGVFLTAMGADEVEIEASFRILGAVGRGSARAAGRAVARDVIKGQRAAQYTPAYHGAIFRFPNGNGSILSIGPFPIILPPLIIRMESVEQ